jgi:hypothetical protein
MVNIEYALALMSIHMTPSFFDDTKEKRYAIRPSVARSAAIFRIMSSRAVAVMAGEYR